MVALLIPLFLGACDQSSDRIAAAAQRKARAEVFSLPLYPGDCRRFERSGVRMGEDMRTALLRTDQALARANARIVRCSEWYDGISEGGARD